MKQKLILCLFVILAAGALLLAPAVPASADSSQPQVVYQTPTAMPDGRIIYKVKEGESCISISIKNSIDMTELQRLNGLGGDCPLRAGQDLLLGVVAASPAPAATATPTPLVPVDAAFGGKGEICINLFDDLNGNGLAEDGELPMAGGAASVTDRLGKTSLTGSTTDSADAPLCFKDVPGGDYNISLAVPDGYNATTALQASMNLRPGDTSVLDFGAQMSSAAKPTPVSEGGRSPMLGIVGGVLLLAGAGLGVYFRMMRR